MSLFCPVKSHLPVSIRHVHGILLNTSVRPLTIPSLSTKVHRVLEHI